MTPVDLLILLIEAFDKLDPIAQLGATGTVFSAIGGPFVWAWHRGRKHAANLIETNRNLKRKLGDSAISISRIEQEIEDQRRMLAAVQAQVPGEALASAASDKVHAQEILTGLFEQLAPPLGTCCREIAFAEVALTLGAEDRPHLHRAERLAEAAALLAPGEQGDLRALRADIAVMRAVWEEDAKAFDAADAHWNTAFDYIGGVQPSIAAPLFQRVYEIGMRRYSEGHYAVAAILLRRAVLIAERTLGPRHINTLTTRNNLAGAIHAQGRAAEAEALYRELLPLREKVLGREHPNTENTRNMLAAIVRAENRSVEAEGALPEARQDNLAGCPQSDH